METYVGLCPILSHTEFLYTRMTAVSWASDAILRPSIFSAESGSTLVSCLRSHETDLPIVINCSGISTIEDHALDEFRKYIQALNREAVFLIDKGFSQLIRETESELRDAYKGTQIINDKILVLAGADGFARTIGFDLMDKIKDVEISFIKYCVKNAYRQFKKPERLTSTPLIASGVLNARSLISQPNTFVWLSLKLADLFENLIEQQKPTVSRILAVSLRGSPFAAAVRLLSHKYSPSLEIVDHIGPQHEILEEHSFYQETYGGEYIYIGDFVIGGTELKIARGYALSKGWSLKGAVAIGSYLPEDEYDKHIKLKTIVNIAEIIPGLTYEFRG